MSDRALPRRHDQGRDCRVPLSWTLLSCLTCSLLLTAGMFDSARAATYYLDATGGSDLHSGSSDRPWQSLEKAQSVVKPGDTVLLRDGDYGPFTLDASAFEDYTGDVSEPLPTTQKWVTYRTEPGQTNVRFGNISFSLGQNPQLVAHAFDGIKITQPKGRCVFAWGVVGLRLRNMTLIGEMNPATLASGTAYYNAVEFKELNTDVTIDNCDIRGGYRGIYAGSRNRHVRIINCNIYDTGVDKIMCGGVANILIEGNRLHGPALLPTEHPDCIQFYTAANRYEGASATNVTIRGNRLYNHSSQGIWTGGSILRNVIFENNLIYTTGNYEWRVYGVHGGIIRNNTIVGDDVGHTGIIIYGGTFTESDGTLNGYPRNRDITVVNNVFATSYSGAPSVMTYHDHNIYVRPWDGSPGENEPHSYGFDSIEAAVAALFVNPDAHDYRLKDSSPAIDFGTTEAGIYPTDIDGNPRGDPPNAGCYEHGSAAPQEPDPDEPPRGNTSDPGDGSVDPVEDGPPDVTIIDPADGSTVGGTVVVRIRATDSEDADGTLAVDVGVSGPDGASFGWSEAIYNLETGYYEFDWLTDSLADRIQYTIDARASDSAANSAQASPVTVIVDHGDSTAGTMHVESIAVFKIDLGGGWKAGGAHVLIADQVGDPVAGADVTATFSGDINETLTSRTNGAGVATFETTGQTKGRCQMTVSVWNVTHPDYQYEPAFDAAATHSRR